jgi:hypothetical protein
MVKSLKRSLRDRLSSVISGQQALQARNGKKDAYIALKTIYKILKAETNIDKAQIRGILNRDFIHGQKYFDRAPAAEGMKRSGAYRLHVEVVESQEIESIVDNQTIEATDGIAA